MRLIDSLELPIGAICNAITSIWAAPEQISLSPITERADIYPVGLMLVSLLSGQMVGEIVRYQVPLQDGTHRVVSILRDPRVFLERDDSRLPLEGEGAWIAFIEKCLRFDPSERHAGAGASAIELEQLITKFPPAGWLSFRLDRGELQMVRLPNETEALARILRDASYGVVTLLKCPSCNAPNRSAARFCQVCGTLIKGGIR